MNHFEHLCMSLSDEEWSRLSLRRQRLQSRRAVCPSCGDPSVGLCAACQEWYDGLTDAEQVAAEHESVGAQLARWQVEARTADAAGDLVPF